MIDHHQSQLGIQTSHSWKGAIISIDSSVRQAVENLDKTALKIVLVANQSGVLEGTISDGDIRRGLLKGMGLDESVLKILHRKALVVPPGMPRSLVLQLMTSNRIQQIPIVDESQHIIGLHVWDDISVPMERSNSMVIMAGGKGIRMRPHTENCPKPLLLIHGKPMLWHIIERAKLEGFSHFVLAIHYLGEMIEDYFSDGRLLGVRIEYLREATPLGTAGSLALLSPRPVLPFVVTNGDVITNIKYGELLDFHVQQSATATMAVRAHEWQNPFGVVRTEGIEIVGFEEKPITRSQINAGVYALDPEALDGLVRGIHCDMPTLFDALQQRSKRTVAYPMHEPWLDVGRPNDLELAQEIQ